MFMERGRGREDEDQYLELCLERDCYDDLDLVGSGGSPNFGGRRRALRQCIRVTVSGAMMRLKGACMNRL